MKKQLSILPFLLLGFLAFAQNGKKPQAKEKAPTQKEMEDMMKEAQKAMNEMSPEDKKMMDSMGIKMPSLNSVPQVSDKQLADAWENETRIVPKRDAARIAAIPATVSNAGVAAYLSSVHNKILTVLQPASKTMGEKIYAQLKSSGKNADAIGKASAGLWMIGRVEIGIYLAGKASIEQAANTNNISNYAAMLSMMGAEQLAIPLLNNLNARFPKNSTLLNNLGQAWFGLGEITKAEKYLDSAIRIYKYHPQANHTKSFIEESKDHMDEALAFEKNAMQHAYTKEREERLRKLGYKMSSNDFKLPPKTKADPFNLGGFSHPSYPKSVDDCIAMTQLWADYRQRLRDAGAALRQKIDATMPIVQKEHERSTQQNLDMVKASFSTGMVQGEITMVPMYASRAFLKLREVRDEHERKLKAFAKKVSDFATGSGLKLTQEYQKEMEKLKKEDADQTGEGLPNRDYCPRYKAASDKYLSAYNSATEALMNESLEITKNFLNDDTYWKMYAEWEDAFEISKLSAKMAWLGELLCEGPLTFKSITDYKCNPPAPKKGDKLAAFDDVACKYHSEMNLYIFKMKSDCSRMTTEIDAPFIKAGLKQDMDKTNFSDQFMSCTFEVSAEIGKEVEMGPVTVGASAKGGMGIEIDRSGAKDVYLIGEAGAGAGPASVTIEGKVSLVSGKSEAGITGQFGNLKLAK